VLWPMISILIPFPNEALENNVVPALVFAPLTSLNRDLCKAMEMGSRTRAPMIHLSQPLHLSLQQELLARSRLTRTLMTLLH
jgi:hypothetical protein